MPSRRASTLLAWAATLALLAPVACKGTTTTDFPVTSSSGADGAGGTGQGASGGSTGVGGGFDAGLVDGHLGCVACDDGQYCDWGYGHCGPPQQGYCVDASDCMNVGPVCGCDGHVYDSDCDAYAAGVDLAAEVPCPPPQDHFRCGWFLCESGVEFCVHVHGLTIDWRCEPLPSECDPADGGALDCSCIDFICSCEQSPSGDITVTCVSV